MYLIYFVTMFICVCFLTLYSTTWYPYHIIMVKNHTFMSQDSGFLLFLPSIIKEKSPHILSYGLSSQINFQLLIRFVASFIDTKCTSRAKRSADVILSVISAFPIITNALSVNITIGRTHPWLEKFSRNKIKLHPILSTY